MSNRSIFTNQKDQADWVSKLLDCNEDDFKIEINSISTYLTGNEMEGSLWYLHDAIKNKTAKCPERWLPIAKGILSQYYKTKSDGETEHEQKCHVDILENKEVRYITTVPAVFCWVLGSIVGSLHTEYYAEIILILEEGIDLDSGVKSGSFVYSDNLYFRKESCIPLANFAVNLRVTDESFKFKKEDRQRIEKIIFEMLEKNSEYPRVLEFMSRVFMYIKFLDAEAAVKYINLFIKNASLDKNNPNYAMEGILPLLIYYAEFKEDHDSSFKSEIVKKYFLSVLETFSSIMLSTTVFNLRRVVEDDSRHFIKFEKYIEKILSIENLDMYVATQLIFFFDKTVKDFPDVTLKFLKRLYDRVYDSIESGNQINYLSLTYGSNILPSIFAGPVDVLISFLNTQDLLARKGLYIDSVDQMHSLYLTLDEDKKEDVYQILKSIISYARKNTPNIQYPEL